MEQGATAVIVGQVHLHSLHYTALHCMINFQIIRPSVTWRRAGWYCAVRMRGASASVLLDDQEPQASEFVGVAIEGE